MVFTPGKGVGLRNVGSYQISGQPFITGSVLAVDEEFRVGFPTVAREFTVYASGSQGGPALRVHFNAASAGDVMDGKHYITVDMSGTNGPATFKTKCTEVYVTCKAVSNADNGFEIIANLTSIHRDQMYALTGSGLTTGDGT